METTRERVRPRERWRDEVQEDLNIRGIKNRQAIASDGRGCRKSVRVSKGHNGL